MRILILFFFFNIFFFSINAQTKKWDKAIAEVLSATLERHIEFVSIPNISPDPEQLVINMEWISPYFKNLGFEISLLKTSTSPVFLAERIVDKNAKTILFYFHLDGQPVDCLLYTSPSPRDQRGSRMPSSA